MCTQASPPFLFSTVQLYHYCIIANKDSQHICCTNLCTVLEYHFFTTVKWTQNQAPVVQVPGTCVLPLVQQVPYWSTCIKYSSTTAGITD
jgi:hypothetical protein